MASCTHDCLASAVAYALGVERARLPERSGDPGIAIERIERWLLHRHIHLVRRTSAPRGLSIALVSAPLQGWQHALVVHRRRFSPRIDVVYDPDPQKACHPYRYIGFLELRHG